MHMIAGVNLLRWSSDLADPATVVGSSCIRIHLNAETSFNLCSVSLQDNVAIDWFVFCVCVFSSPKAIKIDC